MGAWRRSAAAATRRTASTRRSWREPHCPASHRCSLSRAGERSARRGVRVAVTGATGFIGWHACERLRDAGWTVVAIARPGGRAARPPGVELATAPLEAGALCRACEGAAAIVHAAGVIRAASDAEYRRVNVEGARAAAEAARSLGARLVHISSLTAAGPACLARPEREDDPCEPVT